MIKKINWSDKINLYLPIPNHARDFSEQEYIKILGCFKMLKIVHVNLLDFDKYKHVPDM